MSFWQAWLVPRSSDPAQSRRERVLYVLSLSALAASLIWLLAGVLATVLYGPHPRLIGDLIVGGEGVVLFPLAYFLGRRGHVRPATYVALACVLLMQVTSMLGIWVNPLDPTLIFYALTIAVAGLLLGRRAALAFYIVSLVAYLLTSLYLYYTGHAVARIEQPFTLGMIAVMLLLGLGVLLIVVHFYIGSMETALQEAEDRVRRRTQQLQETYQALRQQHTRLDAIVSTVTEGLVVTDPGQRITLVNPAFAALVGRPAEQLLGKPLGEVLPPAELSQTVAQAQGRPATAASARISWSGRIYQATACTLGGLGSPPSGVVTVLHDITPEIEALKARTEFVSAVAHDLRVPLNNIAGYSDLLLSDSEPPLNETQRAYVKTIRRNTEHTVNLVRDLLDLCRLESGIVRVEPCPTSLASAIQEVTAQMRPQMEERGLTLSVDLPPVLPPVLADPRRLNQILTNLLSNACQYTPPGGRVRITARFLSPPQSDLRHCPEAGSGYLETAVADTGIGIAPEDQERIFDRFVRLDHPLVQRAGGTGLGLTIVRQLLHLQGGRIWVDSAPGQGSTFYFSLRSAE